MVIAGVGTKESGGDNRMWEQGDGEADRCRERGIAEGRKWRGMVEPLHKNGKDVKLTVLVRIS